MADVTGVVAGLAQSVNGTASLEPKKKNGEVGKDEFLTMLIAQLKAQDPMDPMKSEEFAVNLAQFTQVEQLTKINEGISKLSGNDSSGSLASYLGQEVSVGTEEVPVSKGDAGTLKLDLPAQMAKVSVTFLDSNGLSKGSKEFTNVAAGKVSLPLSNTGVADGTYALKIEGLTSSGISSNLQGKISGIVSGFIPGSDPKLILGNREVSPSDIKEVNAPPSTAATS